METQALPLTCDDTILVTGASGFLGAKVVKRLLEAGFLSVRCLMRPSSDPTRLTSVLSRFPGANPEIIRGNLQSREDCQKAVAGIAGLVHCAAGMSGGVVSMFTDSVVASRNLLDAVLAAASDIRRIVHVSSFAIYQTTSLKRGQPVTEETPVETHHRKRDDAYGYVKVKQEQLFRAYADRDGLPLVVVRPGVVFGPGGTEISYRVGTRLLGVFLHQGGSNLIPLTFVDNCADAIVLALTQPDIEGEVFNIHDDNLPAAAEFLKGYKDAKGGLPSVTVPYPLMLLLSYAAVGAARVSHGQLPVLFNPYITASIWRGTTFDNSKAKKLLGWRPKVTMVQALEQHFAYIRRNDGR